MPAFGFGVSDFVAVGQLAWKLFEACRAAPGVFATISRELESLHCVLEEAADTQLAQPLPPRRQVRLKVILDNCISVLGDLQYIVQKYHSLGTDDRKAWDKLRLSNEDIAEIRSRLVFNITCLTAFRSYIIDPGAFERHSPSSPQGSWQWVVELSGPDKVDSSRNSIAPSVSNGSILSSGSYTTTLVDDRRSILTTSPKPKSRPKLVSLSTGLSSRKKRLISAINNKNVPKAFEMLNDDSSDVLEPEALDHALWSAAQSPATTPLMEALIERGARVDAIRDKKSVLWNAVSSTNEDAVKFLLSRKVNLKSDHLSQDYLPLREASLRSPPIMALLAKNGAPIEVECKVSSTAQLNCLQEAVFHGREPVARVLLNNGANVDACSSTHGTALMTALYIGRESIAKLLIQKGANINLSLPPSPSRKYSSTVQAAILGRRSSLLELLFRAGAVADMPAALKFAQANSNYPLIPSAGTHYGYGDYNDGARQFYLVMTMLAQRDLRYVCFFHKDDKPEAKREGIRKMMTDLCT